MSRRPMERVGDHGNFLLRAALLATSRPGLRNRQSFQLRNSTLLPKTLQGEATWACKGVVITFMSRRTFMGISKISAAAVIAVGLSTIPLSQSQKNPSTLRDPEIIIAQAVDSPDLVDALIYYDQAKFNWYVAHDMVWGIKFYAGSLMSSAP